MLNPLETRRQILHLIFGLIVSVFVYSGFLGVAELLSIVSAGIIISIISKKYKIPVIIWFLDKFERADAKAKFPGRGAIYFFAGALLSVLLFHKSVAAASVVILALGDSVAPLIGQFGRIRHPFSDAKFLEGMIAGIIAASIGASFFVNPVEAFAASVFAMIAEGIDINLFNEKVDDNLIVPVVAGAVITAVRLAA